jgi:hypothetical protein
MTSPAPGNTQAPPNYPMYGMMGGGLGSMMNPYGTPLQNYRGGYQPPMMYGGLGSMYGGMMRPFPQPMSSYGSPLTNQYSMGLMGANPYAYSQSLRNMAYYQPQMPLQLDLQNLMGYQQGSFNPYIWGGTTDPNVTTTTTTGAPPSTTTGDPSTTGTPTTGYPTTATPTTTGTYPTPQYGTTTGSPPPGGTQPPYTTPSYATTGYPQQQYGYNPYMTGYGGLGSYGGYMPYGFNPFLRY